MYFHVYPVQRMALWVETNFLSPFDDTRAMSLWNIIGIPWAGVIISQEYPVKKFQFHLQTGHVIRCASATSEKFSKPHFDLWLYRIEYRLHSSAVITVIPDRGSWRPPPRSHVGAYTIKRAVSVCPHFLASISRFHLLSKDQKLCFCRLPIKVARSRRQI